MGYARVRTGVRVPVDEEGNCRQNDRKRGSTPYISRKDIADLAFALEIPIDMIDSILSTKC